MSRREQLYRHYLENAYGQSFLPKSALATPNNKLFKEVKASFLFTDPAVYSSEYTRDSLYATAPYFKFLLLKNLADSVTSVTSAAPLNASLINNYLLFYFFGSNDNALGRNAELMKSQFRPLKKGISSMLRLHATGAVAMPIEIRLQVLASSRDVIHSWAIPSASIKIDCVPGYTSHRMMKFLLTGVY
jgi:heme/copper-type cytochrome/quinol oxidase subunit 2